MNRPSDELDPALKEAVDAVRSSEPPADALARALARASALQPRPPIPWRSLDRYALGLFGLTLLALVSVGLLRPGSEPIRAPSSPVRVNTNVIDLPPEKDPRGLGYPARLEEERTAEVVSGAAPAPLPRLVVGDIALDPVRVDVDVVLAEGPARIVADAVFRVPQEAGRTGTLLAPVPAGSRAVYVAVFPGAAGEKMPDRYLDRASSAGTFARLSPAQRKEYVGRADWGIPAEPRVLSHGLAREAYLRTSTPKLTPGGYARVILAFEQPRPAPAEFRYALAAGEHTPGHFTLMAGTRQKQRLAFEPPGDLEERDEWTVYSLRDVTRPTEIAARVR